MLSHILKQLPHTISLAAPVALAQLGYMSMVLVDTYMVGHLGPGAIAGVGVGSSIFWGLTSFFMGTLMGLDPLISQAFGRGASRDCRRWLVQGCYLALVLSIPLTGLIYLAALNLQILTLAPDVEVAARKFLVGVGWSSAPFLLFVAFRQYLQAISNVRVPTIIIIIANLVNLLFNWLLVSGHWGFPALGVTGSALSTSITRTAMFVLIVVFTLVLESRGARDLFSVSRRWERASAISILRFGVPAGFQLLFEVGVFAVASVLSGRISSTAAAAHTIIINIASFTFMVPFGISAASAVQVGQAMGAGRLDEAKIAGWSSLSLAAFCMAVFGSTMLVLGRVLPASFTSDQDVITLAARVLLLAAAFQIADGIQTVGTGALRGSGNTRFAMGANVLGYWVIGLPLGCFLGFGAGYGLPGLWIGLTVGLWMVAILVLGRWARFSCSSALGTA